MRTANNLRPSQRSIRRIVVTGLFGHFDYDLHDRNPSTSPFLILYGDNGSGKTTLLRTTFYLLSDARSEGHKGRLAAVPFKKLQIELGGSLKVIAERKRAVSGSFRALIKQGRKILAQTFFKINEAGEIPGGNEAHDRFLDALGRLRISLFFLSDDRDIISNLPSGRPDTNSYYRRVRRRVIEVGVANLAAPTKPIDRALIRAMEATVTWAKEEVRNLSQRGDEDVNSLYADIVKRAASLSVKRKASSSVEQIYSALQEQKERGASFASFGLVSYGNFDPVLKALRQARRGRDTLQLLLPPYVDALKAKFDALQGLHDSIVVFVNTVNSFFQGKFISFRVDQGLEIREPGGKSLAPIMLSSGEKQLLLLLCNSLIANEEGNLFIVDEPELSLNIKWQRRLLDALLKVARHRGIQFLLATHSFEVLSAHQDRVLHLVSKSPTSNAHTKTKAH